MERGRGARQVARAADDPDASLLCEAGRLGARSRREALPPAVGARASGASDSGGGPVQINLKIDTSQLQAWSLLAVKKLAYGTVRAVNATALEFQRRMRGQVRQRFQV